MTHCTCFAFFSPRNGKTFLPVCKKLLRPKETPTATPSQNPAVGQGARGQAGFSRFQPFELHKAIGYEQILPSQCYKLINLGKIHPKASGLCYQTQVTQHMERGFRATLWLWTQCGCGSTFWNGNIPAGLPSDPA